MKRFSKEKEIFSENDSPEKLPAKLSNSHVSNSPSKSTSKMLIYPPTSNINSQPNNLHNNFYDISILNLNDFKDQLKKSQAFKDLNIDLSISLERGILPADIQKVAGDERIFDSDGYIEEDEEDLKENLEGSPFHSFTNKPVEIQNKRKNSFDAENFNLSNKNPKISDKFNNSTNNQDMDIKFLTNSEKIVVSTPEQLHEVFYGKNKNEDAKYSLTYDEKEFILPNEEREVSPILKPRIVLMILKYLYGELHAGLIELSDNFVEERRKYFTVDQETYVSIINYFLRKKEEFFLCVLSDIMSKLDISQVNLDKTFFYYMNIADPNEDEIIISIREAYDKVYHAGVK